MKYAIIFIISCIVLYGCKDSNPELSKEENERLEKAEKQKQELQSKIDEYSPTIWKEEFSNDKLEDKFFFELQDYFSKRKGLYLVNVYIDDIERIDDINYLIFCQFDDSLIDIEFSAILKAENPIIDKILKVIERKWYEEFALFINIDDIKRIGTQLTPNIDIYSEDDYDYKMEVEIFNNYILTGQCIDFVYIDDLHWLE